MADVENNLYDEDMYKLNTINVQKDCKLHDEKNFESTPLLLDRERTCSSRDFVSGIKLKRVFDRRLSFELVKYSAI